ncbi:hypothetical protein GFS31_14740 [Leptolyngbya sp. BL0902]|uniref:hypothetical protein n=1 Tax=Leptolyngbya sp. BL0902 TaxID=1115757 RepID=UPI0018E6FE7D|nr:hypothetical protein [Leptolyngbya sp. BL0902]QQE64792.1 hypothetical protein GFS31_14740 [Leptolyngbya sp. BL0902]
MAQVWLGICGGFHGPEANDGIQALWAAEPAICTLPTVVLGGGVPWAPLSAHALRQSLDCALAASPSGHQGRDQGQDLILWAFSAGGVGAVSLAQHWQRYRGRVRAIFLLDGWGIPWVGSAPLHRLSHDAFTHRSSRVLGAGRADFFAQPAVPHLQLWQRPQAVVGQGCLPDSQGQVGPVQTVSAAHFLTQWTVFYAKEGRVTAISPDAHSKD